MEVLATLDNHPRSPRLPNLPTMPAIHESPVRRPPRQLQQRPSDASIGHHSIHSNDSRISLSSSSDPPSPTPAPPEPSPRAVEISAAFERVRERSTTLQTALLKSSDVTTRNYVKKFQEAVMNLFQELQNLPDNVPPTPVLISAIQGCSFEVLCFGSSVERFHVGCERWEERQKELVMSLNEAMTSMCILLELAAQAIEDAEAERNRLEESAEVDTCKAERGFGSGSGSSMDGRPLSWLVPSGFGLPVSLRCNPVSSSQCSLLLFKGTEPKAFLGPTSKEGLLNESQEIACAAQGIHSSFNSQQARILEEGASYSHETPEQREIRHPSFEAIRPLPPPQR